MRLRTNVGKVMAWWLLSGVCAAFFAIVGFFLVATSLMFIARLLRVELGDAERTCIALLAMACGSVPLVLLSNRLLTKMGCPSLRQRDLGSVFEEAGDPRALAAQFVADLLRHGRVGTFSIVLKEFRKTVAEWGTLRDGDATAMIFRQEVHANLQRALDTQMMKAVERAFTEHADRLHELYSNRRKNGCSWVIYMPTPHPLDRHLENVCRLKSVRGVMLANMPIMLRFGDVHTGESTRGRLCGLGVRSIVTAGASETELIGMDYARNEHPDLSRRSVIDEWQANRELILYVVKTTGGR